MTQFGDFVYSVIESSPEKISGWIYNVNSLQPVDLLVESNGRTLFTITAKKTLKNVEWEGYRGAGFEVAIDRSIWKIANQVNVRTPNGDIIETLQKPIAGIRKKEQYKEIDHELTVINLLQISGQFTLRDSNGHGNFAKLFNAGKLEAYQSISNASSDSTSEPTFGYDFHIAKGKTLLDNVIFITINDRYAFAGKTNYPLTLQTDQNNYLLPLPIDIDSVIATTTIGAESPSQVLLYNIKHYLGFGDGTVLVFDKNSRFTFRIHQTNDPTLDIAYANGDVTIKQQASEN